MPAAHTPRPGAGRGPSPPRPNLGIFGLCQDPQLVLFWLPVAKHENSKKRRFGAPGMGVMSSWQQLRLASHGACTPPVPSVLRCQRVCRGLRPALCPTPVGQPQALDRPVQPPRTLLPTGADPLAHLPVTQIRKPQPAWTWLQRSTPRQHRLPTHVPRGVRWAPMGLLGAGLFARAGLPAAAAPLGAAAAVPLGAAGLHHRPNMLPLVSARTMTKTRLGSYPRQTRTCFCFPSMPG
jgi:hypothetical protein